MIFGIILSISVVGGIAARVGYIKGELKNSELMTGIVLLDFVSIIVFIVTLGIYYGVIK